MKTLTGVPCNSQGQMLHQENGSSFQGCLQGDDWLWMKYSTVIFKPERLGLDSQLCHSTCWEAYEKVNELLWASFSSSVKWGWKQWVTLIESLGGLNEWVYLNYYVWLAKFLCVNLTRPWDIQIFAPTLYWVCLGRCFYMRLTCDSGNQGKQIALPGVGGPHPISRRPR